MVSDGKGLLASEAHIARRDVDALLAVAVGESIVILEGIDSLPYAALVLDVAEAFFINADLAKIVKQSGDGNAFRGIIDAVNVLYSLYRHIVAKAVVNIVKVSYTRHSRNISPIYAIL